MEDSTIDTKVLSELSCDNKITIDSRNDKNFLDESNMTDDVNTKLPDTSSLSSDVKITLPVTSSPTEHKKITKDCFMLKHTCPPSSLALSQHPSEILSFFSMVFGLDGVTINKPIQLTEDDENDLVHFILKNTCGSEVHKRDIDKLSSDELKRSCLKVQYPQSTTKVLNISLESCLVLTGDLKNGWINDEIFDIWCDSINLLNDFEAEPKKRFPDKFVMSGLSFSRFY